jgi:hypothetical protein
LNKDAWQVTPEDVERAKKCEEAWQKKHPNATDKTERAFAELKRLKDAKQKAKMTLHLDGSGGVAKIEVSQFIQ